MGLVHLTIYRQHGLWCVLDARGDVSRHASSDSMLAQVRCATMRAADEGADLTLVLQDPFGELKSFRVRRNEADLLRDAPPEQPFH